MWYRKQERKTSKICILFPCFALMRVRSLTVASQETGSTCHRQANMKEKDITVNKCYKKWKDEYRYVRKYNKKICCEKPGDFVG